METMLGQRNAAPTPAAMSARVFAEAKRAFSSVADDRVLEQISRDAVDELCRDQVKVTSFVPVLAFRLVRERLETGAGNETGAANGV